MAVLINEKNLNKCVFVVGPTSSGKSSWALEQAEKYKGSIVNIDSIQLYKDLIIGSAAPSEEEKKRVPHYLYNYVEAPKEITAGEYVENFYEILRQQVKFPIFIVGGTGFYIQALEKGMFDVARIPEAFRKEIEIELTEHGATQLYEELLRGDPDTKIHLNDHFRLVRAIEILRFTGKAPTQLKMEAVQNKNKFPYNYVKLGFDFEKSDYERRVLLRTQKMLERGIIEETKRALDSGFETWSPLYSVGYRETVEYLKMSYSSDWLIEAINRSTMKLIKKQKTWFKRDLSILWSNQEQTLNQFLS